MYRNTRQFALVVATLALLVAHVQAADEKFGAGVLLADATPIADVYASPEQFVGKTVRLDGVITAVCESMGCWLAIAPADRPDQAVRFQAEHDGSIVFPMSLKGRNARAEGLFQRIAESDEHATEAATEHAQHQPEAAHFGKRYQIKVTGAIVQ